MQILYRGVKPADVVYVGVCGVCKTKATFTRGEAKEAGSQRDGFHLWVKCPVCDGQIVSEFVKHVPRVDYPCGG